MLDLVDMAEGRTTPGGGKKASRAMQAQRTAETITKEHSDPMGMTEFAQWYGATFGTLGLRDALQQAAFLLCCDVIAQDVAKAELHLRERLPNGTSRVVEPNQHPVAAFLAEEPNARHTWYEFKEMMGLWHALSSNSLAVIRRNRMGEPLAVIPVQTGCVISRVVGNEIFYDVNAGSQEHAILLGGYTITVPERDMIHVRGRMLDGMDGYSTLIAGKTTLSTGKAIEDYRSTIFSEDGQLRGVFTREHAAGVLPDDAFKRLRSQFRELMRRVVTSMEPIVLEGGLKFDKISANPKEAELTLQFEAQVVATCRLLRVPPHKVFHLVNVKYENLETMEKSYVGDTLIPVCLRHEQRYGRAFLSPKDRKKYFLEHDREALVLHDTKAVTERAVKGAERGIYTFDEARAMTGKNPLPNGQGKQRMIPANMSVVDENGKVVIGGTNTPAAGQTDGEEPVDQEEEKTADVIPLRRA